MQRGSRDDMDVEIEKRPIIPKRRSKSVPRRIGAARFDYVPDRARRSKHLSYHVGSLLQKANMIYLTTGALVDVRVLPDTGNMTLYTTGASPDPTLTQTLTLTLTQS